MIRRGKHRPTVKVMQMYLALKQGPITCAQMRDVLGIGRRSFYYYLWSLEDAGVHLLSEDDPENPRRKCWRLAW